jgi:CO/xanthine dehydrogenase FAD-binding subunit
MTTVRAYHRPATIDDALDLLQRPGVVPLGGGTVLNGQPDEVPTEVVDLQALGLDEITREGSQVRIGAMATLQTMVDNDSIPPLLRDLAHREAPNTLRNAATIGGTVAAADPESELLAGLLASGAMIEISERSGRVTVGLADLLAMRSQLDGNIISNVVVDIGSTGRAARVGRTPADTPIVMVAGVRNEAGVMLAATGVAATPVIIDLDHLDELDPPGDFRGSPAYRRHVAGTLGARVVAELAEDTA